MTRKSFHRWRTSMYSALDRFLLTANTFELIFIARCLPLPICITRTMVSQDVCPSVCYMPVLRRNGSTCQQTFSPQHSSLPYQTLWQRSDRAPVRERRMQVKVKVWTLAFSVAGPMAWNALTDDLRDLSLSADNFRKTLKTHLFRNALGH